MTENKKIPITLQDFEVNVRLKLSALWATLMFIYLYVDFFALFEPGTLEHMIAGKIWVLDITQGWVISAIAMMTIPSLMVFLPLVLPPKANRLTNIIVAILYILIAIGNPIGETWASFWIGSAVEIVLLALIVWYSWKWPKEEE